MTSLTEAAGLPTAGRASAASTSPAGWVEPGTGELSSEPAADAAADRATEAPDAVVLALSGLRLDVRRDGPFLPTLRVTMPGRPPGRAWPVEPTLIADWRVGRQASAQRAEPRFWTAAWGAVPTGWRAPRVEFRVRRRRRRLERLSVPPTLLAGGIWVAEIGARAGEVAVGCAGLLESRDLRP